MSYFGAGINNEKACDDAFTGAFDRLSKLRDTNQELYETCLQTEPCQMKGTKKKGCSCQEKFDYVEEQLDEAFETLENDYEGCVDQFKQEFPLTFTDEDGVLSTIDEFPNPDWQGGTWTIEYFGGSDPIPMYSLDGRQYSAYVRAPPGYIWIFDETYGPYGQRWLVPEDTTAAAAA